MPGLDGLPVAIAHGTEDPIIPVAHFIDPHVVGDLAAWVQARRASAPLA
jgi:predicted esterase